MLLRGEEKEKGDQKGGARVQPDCPVRSSFYSHFIFAEKSARVRSEKGGGERGISQRGGDEELASCTYTAEWLFCLSSVSDRARFQ